MDATEPRPESHGVAAEPDRVPARLVVGSAIVLTVTAAIAAVLMAVLFWRLNRTAETRDEKVVAAAGLERREPGLPPLPRLQVFPVRHWKGFEAAERERLESYGWMDRSTGAVHVPIGRAMDLIAERGVGPLPQAPMAVPGPAPTPAAAGVKK